MRAELSRPSKNTRPGCVSQKWADMKLDSIQFFQRESQIYMKYEHMGGANLAQGLKTRTVT